MRIIGFGCLLWIGFLVVGCATPCGPPCDEYCDPEMLDSVYFPPKFRAMHQPGYVIEVSPATPDGGFPPPDAPPPPGPTGDADASVGVGVRARSE